MPHLNQNEQPLEIKGIATCVGCGCDDLHACPQGCSWLTLDRTEGFGVCSCCDNHLEHWRAGILRRSLKAVIPDADYGHAVLKLLPIAQGDTGGAEPAARVLLSAYNGYEFDISIPDLGVLDPGNFTAAMTVIICRAGPKSREPHTVIDNGSAIFQRLATQWQHINMNREARS